VNQICRALERDGLVTRWKSDTGPIINVATGAVPMTRSRGNARGGTSSATSSGSDARAGAPAASSAAQSRGSAPTAGVRDEVWVPPVGDALVVFPCSGAKVRGESGARRGRGVADLLPDDLAHWLGESRQALRGRAAVDETRLVPAYARYSGGLYARAAPAIEGAMEREQPMAILSGGYGVVLPGEGIGMYDRAFTRSDWPGGLLPRVLLALLRASGRSNVVGFCARTTGYADVIRRTPWREVGAHAFIVSPMVGPQQGAQGLVPRVLGSILTTYLLDGEVPHEIGDIAITTEEC